jgi:phosphoglycerate dehydrogenase-like enzyme
MIKSELVAVCSRSFSKNLILREELLKKYCNVKFNDEGVVLSGESLIDFLSDAKKAIVALEKVDKFVLEYLPNLEVISKYGVGLDMIDLDSMRKYNKRLGWSAGVNRRSVSELVVAFAICMLRKVPQSYREILQGGWHQMPGGLLSGRTVGIIGCGNIGQDLVKLLRGFDCRILVNDIAPPIKFCEENSLQLVSIEDLLQQSDVVSIHIPLDGSTKGILNKSRLSLMRPQSILINTARGGLVDEDALKDMLKDQKLLAAAFDVFSIEPPNDMELLSLKNFLATPHIGGSAVEAILAMGRAAIDGLDDNFIP